MANPPTKCLRPGCGKPRSWHLGLGGMGICRPEFKNGTSEMTKSDESTGGFLTLADVLTALPANAMSSKPKEHYAFLVCPACGTTHKDKQFVCPTCGHEAEIPEVQHKA